MGVVWHFGWASWAVHGIWGMVSVHDGAHGVVHVPDGGLVNACVYSKNLPISKYRTTVVERFVCSSPTHENTKTTKVIFKITAYIENWQLVEDK